ncbi:hypothetical protein FRC02_000611 [Tulasnella sp. 418]|nr:hypothetical protein FRC02_000611 [Tulasnella sp. 418]
MDHPRMNSIGQSLIDSDRPPRSGVVGSFLSYRRAQTFLSGSNIASTPSESVFDSDEYSDEAEDEGDFAEEDQDGSDWGPDGNAHEEHEGMFEIPGTWDSPDPAAPTTLGPATLPSSSPLSYPRSLTRPRNFRTRPQNEARFNPGSLGPTSPRLGSQVDPAGPPMSQHNLQPSSVATQTRLAFADYKIDERTPLVQSNGSQQRYAPSRSRSPKQDRKLGANTPHRDVRKLSQTSTLGRRPSMKRRRSSVPHVIHGGKSTWGQTLFNSIAILLGIGMLSEPLAFACAGWIGGTCLIIFYGFITCYTAKILGRVIISDPRLRTYADIGQAAFGPRSNMFTSILFCLELFAVCVVLVVLFSDSLHAVLPLFSSSTYKYLGLLIIIPTSFLPLRVLSFASVLGVLSTLMLIVVVIVDGLSKKHAPGSLWEPAHTEWWASGALTGLPLSFGLFMAGFAGHAVIPSLIRDMADPREFKSMLNWAFAIATVVYAAIGAAGYRMFGHNVSDEVSQDLLKTPGYNAFLNQIAVWMLVLSPLTKFSLTARPLSVTLEIMLGIEESTSPIPPHNQHTHGQHTKPPHKPGVLNSTDEENPQNLFMPPDPRQHILVERKRAIFRAVERTILAIAVVLVAIYIPNFSTTMAFLGAFSAFMLCVIGPVAAKMALEGQAKPHDILLMIIAIIMAGWGTWIGLAQT